MSPTSSNSRCSIGGRTSSAVRRSGAVAIYLVIGTVHAVLVAWGCALFSETPVLTIESGEPRWPMAVDAGWPETPHAVLFGRRGGYEMCAAQCLGRRPHPTPPGRPRLFTEYRLEQHDFGWPVPAMRALRIITKDGTEARHAVAMPAVLDPLARNAGRRLPLAPMWPGFVVDALLYSGFAWLLLEAPGLLRRGVRAWHGRCVACGYDLRGASGRCCPECGTES